MQEFGRDDESEEFGGLPDTHSAASVQADQEAKAAENIPPPAKSVGVLRVKNRDFAVGLFWASIEDTSEGVAEAKAMATREGTESDFYVIHLSASPQYGLGSRVQGHRAKMPSLAANLADSKSGSWLACFAVAERYYLVAVRDDGVFPGTDIVYATEEEARVAFERLMGMGEWESLIAPSSFGLSETKELPIGGLLIGSPRFRLVDVAGRSRVVYLAASFAAIAILGFVAFQFYQDWQEREAAEQLRRMREAAERPFTSKVEIPPMPWEGRPVGAAFMQRCTERIGKLRLVEPPGWHIQTLTCEGGDKPGATNWVAVAVFERDDAVVSSINWVKAAAVRVDGGLGVVPDGPGAERAKVGSGLGDVPLIPIDIKPLAINAVKPFLWSHFDENFIHIAIPDGDRNQFWTTSNFTFRTPLPLVKDSKEAVSRTSGVRDIAGILAQVPALVVSKVTYDPRSSVWAVEGKIYEQHIPQNAQRAPRR